MSTCLGACSEVGRWSEFSVVALGLFAIELFLVVTKVDLNFVARCSAFLGALVLWDIN